MRKIILSLTLIFSLFLLVTPTYAIGSCGDGEYPIAIQGQLRTANDLPITDDSIVEFGYGDGSTDRYTTSPETITLDAESGGVISATVCVPAGTESIEPIIISNGVSSSLDKIQLDNYVPNAVNTVNAVNADNAVNAEQATEDFTIFGNLLGGNDNTINVQGDLGVTGNVGIGASESARGLLKISGGGNRPAIIFDVDTTTENNGADYYIKTKGKGGATNVTHLIGNWGTSFFFDFGYAEPPGPYHAVGITRGILTKGTNARDDDTGFGILNVFKGGTPSIKLAGSGRSYLNGGNVGIGTTAPTAKLHVAGNTKIDGTVTANSFEGDGSKLTGISISDTSSFQPSRIYVGRIDLPVNSIKVTSITQGETFIGTEGIAISTHINDWKNSYSAPGKNMKGRLCVTWSDDSADEGGSMTFKLRSGTYDTNRVFITSDEMVINSFSPGTTWSFPDERGLSESACSDWEPIAKYSDCKDKWSNTCRLSVSHKNNSNKLISATVWDAWVELSLA